MVSAPTVLFGNDTSGLDAKKPANPNVGAIFLATDTNIVYYYDGTAWQVLGAADAYGAGAAAGTRVTAVERVGGGGQHFTELTLDNTHVTSADNGAAGGQASQKVYDFPTGRIQIDGAEFNLAVLAGYTGIANNSTLLASLGSVAAGAGDATLTGTEANMIPSTALGATTLSSGAGTFKNAAGPASSVLDGTGTAIDAILNMTIDATGSTAASAIIVSGKIRFWWRNLGQEPAITAPTTSTTTTAAP